jgi:L-iditol 2-dehydrogenase
MQGLAKLAPGPGNVALAERPEPEVTLDHVVVDVVAAGICGTDIHIFDGEYASQPPVTMGHEVSGVVVDLGECVDASWRGARIVTETYFSTCGHCRWCREGRINLCPERRSIGSFVDGGFAPRLLVPARNLHRIPDWLDGREAAMVEPLACCCHSLLDPDRVAAGDSVLVVGPGPIGLLAAQVARAAGADVHVRGTPKDTARLQVAAALGFATSTTDAGGVEAFDVVVECSGHESGMTFALESVRRGGRYVQIGLAGRHVSVPFDLVCFGELTVTSGNASTPASWDRALELIGERRVELGPLLTDAVPLAEWERAFGATRSGAGIKFVLVP